jgi:putative metallohydrolase (TIGR04338 family)
MSERTCQQFELYASEGTVPIGIEFETVDEAQNFVDAMRETAVWRRQYANVLRIEACWRDAGDSSVGAWYPDVAAGVVEMLPAHRNELTLCHEVAHVLASARYGSHSHDPWFARTYLELVHAMMGPDAYLALYEAFEAHGIDHTHDSSTPAGTEL